MRREPLVRSLFLIALFFVPTGVYAQGSISGFVRDASGGPLPGVAVEAASPAFGDANRTAVTDGRGRYQLMDLRPGPYALTFRLPGFRTLTRDLVTVANASAATVDVVMRVPMIETITVVPRTRMAFTPPGVMPPPSVVCGMTIIPLDPTIDPTMRHTLPETGAKPGIRTVPPPMCW